MPAGYPVKVNYLTGDVLTAADLNDLAGTVNFYDPTAKGDLFPATAADAVSRLAVGANDTVLTADSTAATGMKWAAAGGGGSNFSLLNAGGTALTGAQTITVSGISGQDKIFIRVRDTSITTENQMILVRLNTDSEHNYFPAGNKVLCAGSYNAGNLRGFNATQTGINLGETGPSGADSGFAGAVTITGCNSSGVKVFQAVGGGNGSSNHSLYNTQGIWDNSATVTSVSIFTMTGTFDAGRIFVYASA